MKPAPPVTRTLIGGLRLAVSVRRRVGTRLVRGKAKGRPCGRGNHGFLARTTLRVMRRPSRAVVRSALGVALIAGVFAAVVPRIASYGTVAHRLGTVSAPWLAALAAAALADVLTTALPWRAVLPQLSWLGGARLHPGIDGHDHRPARRCAARDGAVVRLSAPAARDRRGSRLRRCADRHLEPGA